MLASITDFYNYIIIFTTKKRVRLLEMLLKSYRNMLNNIQKVALMINMVKNLNKRLNWNQKRDLPVYR